MSLLSFSFGTNFVSIVEHYSIVYEGFGQKCTLVITTYFHVPF